jgi:hypothetical protein
MTLKTIMFTLLATTTDVAVIVNIRNGEGFAYLGKIQKVLYF